MKKCVLILFSISMFACKDSSKENSTILEDKNLGLLQNHINQRLIEVTNLVEKSYADSFLIDSQKKIDNVDKQLKNYAKDSSVSLMSLYFNEDTTHLSAGNGMGSNNFDKKLGLLKPSSSLGFVQRYIKPKFSNKPIKLTVSFNEIKPYVMSNKTYHYQMYIQNESNSYIFGVGVVYLLSQDIGDYLKTEKQKMRKDIGYLSLFFKE